MVSPYDEINQNSNTNNKKDATGKPGRFCPDKEADNCRNNIVFLSENDGDSNHFLE
jgi:hypothetical protein